RTGSSPANFATTSPAAKLRAAHFRWRSSGSTAPSGSGRSDVLGKLRYRRRPGLSIVVVVYRMPAQAERTLHSLSTAYQTGVTDDEYEVIVVENESEAMLGEAAAVRAGANFRYLFRADPEPSPVFAVNAGVTASRAEMIAVAIDGARMVTPGVVRNVL